MRASLLVLALVALSSPAQAGEPKAPKGATAQLVLKISPPDDEVFVDGDRKGTAAKVHEVPVTPGTHDVTVKYKGDEHTREVTLKRNQSSTLEWAIEESKPMAEPGAADDMPTDDGK